jgi:asparagine synthase (glutamine-hydrolysing)
MCGICGIVGQKASVERAEEMIGFLKHRGPDHRETWIAPGVALGHARLAIVDLTTAGNQPMSNEDGTMRIVANGEIYNSNELRKYLEGKGHVFRSRSDNEVLLHLYEEENEGFLARLNGMFAFAIWDGRKRLLMLGRDRLGIKPLYYCEGDAGISFASEIKALLAAPRGGHGIDLEGLAQYLTFENTFGARTLHRDISLLEPGHGMIWQEGRKRIFRYWSPEFRESGSDFTECCEQYRAVADRSVQRHLMSDVEVASYLSSGFDSTAVAHFAAKHMDRPLSTFTGAFNEGGWFDETEGARAVAESIGANHTEVRIGCEDLEKHFDNLIYSMDEPRMGIGAFSQYMVAQKVAGKCKVILTGHGGDELFAGYPVFKLVYLLREAAQSPLSVLTWPARVRASEWPHLAYFLGRRAMGRGASLYLPVIMNDGARQDCLLPEVSRVMAAIEPADGARKILGEEKDPYRRLTLTYLLLYLPGLFVVEDKISMAHSLESRVPLCDNELVELALSWPLSQKLHHGSLKAIPKEAMRGILPDVLWQMPKRGFPTPLSKWLRGPLRAWMTERLLAPGSALNGLFRPEYLRIVVRQYLEGWQRRSRPLDEIPTHRIWVLLSLEAWLRVFARRQGVNLEL